MRSAIQASPVYRLNEDLSQIVLKAAERKILTGCDRQEVGGGQGGTAWRGRAGRASPPAPPWKPMLHRFLRPGTLLWPAAAVAAAILLYVAHPQGVNLPPDAGKARLALVPAKVVKSSEPGTMGPAKDIVPRKAAQSESASGRQTPNPAIGEDPASRPAGKFAATTKPQMPLPQNSTVSSGPGVRAESNATRSGGADPAVNATQLAKSGRAVERAGASGTENSGEASAGPAVRVDNSELMVVYCDVASGPSGGRAFEELLKSLKRHHLQLKAIAHAQDPLAVLVERLMAAATPVSEGSSRPALPAIRPVYVRAEGTPAEIDVSVAELKAHPDAFPYCSVRFGKLTPIHAESGANVSPQSSESAHAINSAAPLNAGRPLPEPTIRSVVFVVRTVPSNSAAAPAAARQGK